MRPSRPDSITRRLLREWPLPDPDSAEDKDDRGAVLVIGGSRSIPGAVILAGTAALRSGAGKLMIATSKSVAAQVGVAIPEAKSVGLPEDRNGYIASSAAATIPKLAEDSDAMLIGPGMENAAGTRSFVTSVLKRTRNTPVVIDAGAIESLKKPRGFHQLGDSAVITPHAGEMASLMNAQKEEIETNAERWAARAAAEMNAVVALKGPETIISDSDGNLFLYRGGGVGLATSGSGDVLAGIVTGFLARGASPVQAAVWGVFIHGEAGKALAKKFARVGFLAHEIVDEVPVLLDSI
jgi:hydroxyethylthiazole kinase-like uncharacterized protein yjeF